MLEFIVFFRVDTGERAIFRPPGSYHDCIEKGAMVMVVDGNASKQNIMCPQARSSSQAISGYRCVTLTRLGVRLSGKVFLR